MLGQLVFSEIPFATVGQLPYVERGWIKECAEKNEWDVKPKAESSWTVQPRSSGDWSKQDINDVNTVGCGELRPIIRRDK